MFDDLLAILAKFTFEPLCHAQNADAVTFCVTIPNSQLLIHSRRVEEGGGK